MNMIKGMVWSIVLLAQCGWSESDLDMDGVPDALDVCSHTPFLDQVNKYGCSVNRLILPDERIDESMDMVVGYGMTHNEDTIGREAQHSTQLALHYYRNDWIYAVSGAYFGSEAEQGFEDTVVSIKKRLTLSPDFKFTGGLSMKLPSYDMYGNQTDYTLSGSLNYYPSDQWVCYLGGEYTFVNDQDKVAQLSNSRSWYSGIGYFLLPKVYVNVAYGYSERKFREEHPIQTIQGTLFYQLNDRWFTTLSYGNELFDEDLHSNLSIKLGYTLW